MNTYLIILVYLRSSPEVVFKRMQRRNRPEERSMKLQYLVDLHEYYENWLMKKNNNGNLPLLVIDVSKDLSEIQLLDIYRTYEEIILGKQPILQHI